MNVDSSRGKKKKAREIESQRLSQDAKWEDRRVLQGPLFLFISDLTLFPCFFFERRNPKMPYLESKTQKKSENWNQKPKKKPKMDNPSPRKLK